MTDANREDNVEQDVTALPPVLLQSLCVRCDQRRIIRSGKGSVFLLCQVGTTDPRWPKYPPQPIQRCPKFTQAG